MLAWNLETLVPTLLPYTLVRELGICCFFLAPPCSAWRGEATSLLDAGISLSFSSLQPLSLPSSASFPNASLLSSSSSPG